MFSTLILAVGVGLTASAASVSPASTKIEVSTLEDGKIAKPAITFSVEDKLCFLVQESPKKEVKVTQKICQEFLEKNKLYLEAPDTPSDLLSSQIPFYEVNVIYGGKNWNRIVKQNQNSLCTAAGKCHSPEKPAAWRLVQALQDLLKAH